MQLLLSTQSSLKVLRILSKAMELELDRALRSGFGDQGIEG
jgi:hypothetical protein